VCSGGVVADHRLHVIVSFVPPLSALQICVLGGKAGVLAVGVSRGQSRTGHLAGEGAAEDPGARSAVSVDEAHDEADGDSDHANVTVGENHQAAFSLEVQPLTRC
jgi:hypothetical protein